MKNLHYTIYQGAKNNKDLRSVCGIQFVVALEDFGFMNENCTPAFYHWNMIIDP